MTASICAVCAVCAVSAPTAAYAAPSKEQCVEAHGKGQDAREQGKLSSARELFLSCAQAGCPGLIQADCARFGDEVDRLVPTVTFGARDVRGADVEGVSVMVDEVLVTSRLDAGKSYPLDPGRHVVRFSAAGREATLTVVLTAGEKGRPLIASFAGSSAPPAGPAPAPSGDAVSPPPPGAGRSAVPLVFAGIGGAALLAGGVMVALGVTGVPSRCTFSSRECAAPPGDPVFDDAKKSVTLANIGIGAGIGGAALLTGGLIWYFAQPRDGEPRVGIAPWAAPGAGGALVGGRF